MEKVLLKLARQLNAFDEASMMALWDRYAEQVKNFEPTKRWEEAAIVFGMIQALRMKNQLFNYNWSLAARPDKMDKPRFGDVENFLENAPRDTSGKGSSEGGAVAPGDGAAGEVVKQRTKVLRFRPRESDDPV